VVYTGIFGDYDKLLEPSFKIKNNEIDFICLTNNKSIVSKFWDVIYYNDSKLSNHMLNRKVKFFPHLYFKDYDYSLYIDGNIFLKKNPKLLLEKYCVNNFLIALPKHMDRNCVYDEAEMCIRLKKDRVETIKEQMDHYHELGFPKNNGLFENNLILRNHNDLTVIAIMNSWWGQVNRFSGRDQLSLCFCLWQKKVNPNEIIESSRITNDYFDIVLHAAYRNMPFMKKVFTTIDMKKHKNFYYGNLFRVISIFRRIKSFFL
jgi:hypothetical protein